MFIKSVELKNYRNYADLSLEFVKNKILLIGKNAQGKTNLLESLYYLSCLNSSRAKTDSELIMWDKSFAKLKAVVLKNDMEKELDILINPPKRKEMKVNQVKKSKSADFCSNLSVVYFSVNDLLLLRGVPDDRRSWLDMAISQIYPAYPDRISKYNGVETTYATRTPDRISNARIVGVYTDGTSVMGDYENDYGIRPMIIIYNTCLLDDDNNIIPDFAPTITSSFATNGEDIGTKTDYFTFTYTVTTARSDLTLAVDEIISGKNITKTKQTIYPSSGYQRTFSLMVDNHEDFYKLLNGEIKLTIRAYYSDYNNAAVNTVTEYYITFTKDVKGAVITLKSPLTVSGTITKGIITLAGDIPDDGLTVQATRNGTSYSPSWQDVTYYVKNNTEFNFTSTSGSAFNFKITLSRDSTNEPRYISAIVGAFE